MTHKTEYLIIRIDNEMKKSLRRIANEVISPISVVARWAIEDFINPNKKMTYGKALQIKREAEGGQKS